MSKLEHSPTRGSVTPYAGEGENVGTTITLLSLSSHRDQFRMHAAEQTQAHLHTQSQPPRESPSGTSTHLYLFQKPVNQEKQDLGTRHAQLHPSGDCPTCSSTQKHPASPSSTSHILPSSQNGEQPECNPSNDKLTLSPYAKLSSKLPPKNKKAEMKLLEKLSSSKRSLKKLTARKKASTCKDASASKTLTRMSCFIQNSSIPEQCILEEPPFPPKQQPNTQILSVSTHPNATRKEASTSTRTDPPVLTDSALHNQPSVSAQSVRMPGLLASRKVSPSYSMGSSGSTPTKEGRGRRTINANTAPFEPEPRKTEGETDRLLMKAMQNGMEMESLLQQEIERLSLQKRDVVMRDRVIEPESWKREVQKQTEEELEERVREALETPPLERMRRNRHKAKLKHAQYQQRSVSLEECDSYAHTLPSLYSTNHHWEFSETSFAHNEQYSANRQNRFSQLAGRSNHSGRLRDSDTEGDSDTDSPPGSSSAYAVNRRLGTLHHVDNRFGENGLSVTRKTEYRSDSEGSNSEQARTLSEVRRKMFRQYTADGFKSAIRKGRCKLTKIGSGKYEDKNGIVLTMDGPFWPPECGPLYPKPEHQNFIPQEKELLADVVLGHSHTAHTQPTMKQFRPFEPTSISVYDSERTSKGTVPHIIPDGCSSSLVFESRFESGNLRQARRVGQFEYELILKTDLYTSRHTQWFYFRVQRMIPGVTYKFNIINFHKKDSLYNHGMKPLMYSEREAAQSSVGWHRKGHHINYGRSSGFQRNPLLRADMAYYTLSWQMEFNHENDTCYFAHCYPYTFSDLRDHIDSLLSDPERQRCTKREVMCESRAGNSCFLITVTNFSEKQVGSKRGIVVTARVHPGETNASWMMKGLLDYITGSDPVAKDLRKAFVFKIIPMLNPDGVIVGNYRCSLTGRDLNRNFRHPKKESFPTVWHAKEMLEGFSKELEVLVYCDLHGHSRKHNVFIYGCDKNGKETDAVSFLYQRLFPFLMSRKAPDKFSFRGCKFHVKRCKEATGRVVMWKELGISNSFTMEATFCGSKDIRREDTPRHFNFSDFEDLGRHFCEALMVYHEAQENKSLHSELILELTREITHQILQSRGLLPQQLLIPHMQNEGSRHKGADEAISSQSIMITTETQIDKSDAISDATRAPSSGPDKPAQLVRSLHGRLETIRMIDTLSSETIAGCIGILKDLHAMNDFAESDSSDSDSASESEAPPRPQEKEKQDDKKKKKKKGKNRSRSMPPGEYGKPSKAVKTYPPFVNRYIGRRNAGIPMFAQERLEERTSKRMESMKKLEQERLERQSTGLQLADEDGDHAHLLALPNHGQEELLRFKLDPSASPLMVHCRVPRRAGNHSFQINFKQDYTHQNLAMIRGVPMGSDMKRNNSPRRLDPVGGTRIPDTGRSTTYDLDNQTFSISQSLGATVDHVTPDVKDGPIDAGTVGSDFTNQRLSTGIDLGRLTNGVAGRSNGTQHPVLGLNGARTLTQFELRRFSKDGGKNQLHPTRLLSSGISDSRGDHIRTNSSSKSVNVSNPALRTRNPTRHTLGNDTSFSHGPLPIRSPRSSRQTSEGKKNHVELIEQQYGHFLSGVETKRAPSAAAKYLQSLAKSLKGTDASSHKEGMKKEL